MAKVLFTAWPFAGCVHPQIAVARCLVRRGHSVAFYTGSRYRSLVLDHQFEFFPFQNDLELAAEKYVRSSDAMGLNWGRPWRLRPQIRGLFLDTVPLQVADINRIASAWDYDGIVTDPALWAPFLILAEAQHTPVAILSYACGCMLPGPEAPPLGPGLPLPRHFVSKLFNRATGIALDIFMSQTRKGASVMRQEFGLPEHKGPVIELARRLPLYLLPGCPEFDYRRRDLPPCVHYVGSLQWYPQEDRPKWLDDLPAHRPLVHVTEGTLHVRDSFLLRAACIGLADLPVEVVVATFDDRGAADLGLETMPHNVHLVKWISHEHLLPRTAVLLTTAGGGTIAAAMQYGVPAVAVPTEWDKAENAQRVVEAGAGVRLSPRRCTPENLRSAVQTILKEESYRRNAQRMAEAFATMGGPERAAVLVEEMVNDAPGSVVRQQHLPEGLCRYQ